MRRSTSSSWGKVLSVIRETILKTQEDIERYYAVFGRFIDHFSQVEQRFHSLLWELSEGPLELVRVAFHDARFGQVTNLINRLYISREMDEPPLYRKAVQQMGIINTTRNDMVHLGASLAAFEGGGNMAMLISNEIKAIPGKGKSYRVTLEMLDAMLYDLNTIMACLTVVLAEMRVSNGGRANLIEMWRQTAERAWLYKLPQQSQNHQQRHASRRGQKPPHAPSRG